MQNLLRCLFGALLACGAAHALAGDQDFKDLRIRNAHAFATPPGARVGGAYLLIENRGRTDDALIAVSSPVAGLSEIHEMTMDGNMMRMRAVKRIALPAGSKVELANGGYHVMLQELRRPLKAGENIPVRLTFEKAGSVDLLVHVEPFGVVADPARVTKP